MLNLNGLRQWKCAHGHVLGVIQRVEVDDIGRKRWATRLLLFRQAIDVEHGDMAEVDVMANVEGTTLDVRCSVPGCGCVRSWFIGQAAMERLLEKVS